jgi:hypothetical protein
MLPIESPLGYSPARFAPVFRSRLRPEKSQAKGIKMTAPVIAQKSPHSANVRAGESCWWGACGQSKRRPLCDGTHNTL